MAAIGYLPKSQKVKHRDRPKTFMFICEYQNVILLITFMILPTTLPLTHAEVYNRAKELESNLTHSLLQLLKKVATGRRVPTFPLCCGLKAFT